MKRALLLLLPLLTAPSWAVPTAEAPLVAQRPQFTAVTLADRVVEALGHAKKHDIGYVLDLAKHDAPEALLDLLEPHLDEPDYQVQYAVLAAASSLNVDRSWRILTSIVAGRRAEGLAHEAVHSLYNNAESGFLSRGDFRSRGGHALRDALIGFVRSQPERNLDSELLMLLSCFGADPEVTRLLRELHQAEVARQSRERRQTAFGPPAGSPVVALSLGVSVALAAQNDADGEERLLKALSIGNRAELLYVLHSIAWIESRAVLQKLVERLGDRRAARTSGLSHGPRVQLRVCDVALAALRHKLAAAPLNLWPLQRASDIELVQARRDFQLLLQKRK